MARPYPAVAALLAAALLFPLIPAPAQDSKPKQEHLIEGQLSFQHKEAPQFLFSIPKKKKSFAPMRERWRFVDKDARKAQQIENIDRAIEQEEQREPKNEERLNDLRHQKKQTTQFFDGIRALLEVDGEPDEQIRIFVHDVPKNATIEKFGIKAYANANWRSVEFLEDRATTSGRLKKSGGFSHHWEFYGTDKKEVRRYYFVDMFFIRAKGGVKSYRIMYWHQMPAKSFDKKTRKDAIALFKCLRT